MKRRQQDGGGLRAELIATLRDVVARPYGVAFEPMLADAEAGRPVEVPPWIHPELRRRFPTVGRVRVETDGTVTPRVQGGGL